MSRAEGDAESRAEQPPSGAPEGRGGHKHWLYALVPDWIPPRLLVPRGLPGWVSGRMMARLNTEMNRELVTLLALAGDEHVLEIGYGPGVGMGLLVDALPDGRVAGIDASPLMLREATRRNRQAIAAGRVDLRLGSVASLPWPDAVFDAVASANAVQIWDGIEGWASEVHRVLRPGGRLVISTHEWGGEELEHRVPQRLSEGGFSSVTTSRALDTSGATLHFLAAA